MMLLQGELTMVDIAARKLLVFQPGNFFCNISSDNEISRFPAYLIASEISMVAVLPKSYVNLMLSEYTWMNNFLYSVKKSIYSYCENSLYEIGITYEDSDIIFEEEYSNLSHEKKKMIISSSLSHKSDQSINVNQLLSHEVKLHVCDSSQSLFLSDALLVHPYFLNSASRFYFLIYLIHLLNIIIILIFTPLTIVFNLSVTGNNLEQYINSFWALELLTLAEMIGHIIIRFRTSLLIKGYKYSYQFNDIFWAYWKNGLIWDLFGLSIFNMIFWNMKIESPEWIIFPLRILRCGCVGNVLFIVSYLQLRKSNFSSTIHILTIFGCFLLLWHWISVLWIYVCSLTAIEVQTWMEFYGFEEMTPLYQYICSLYYIIKIVSKLFSGDCFPASLLERIVTLILILTVDCIFAMLFGLIAAFASSFNSDSESLMRHRDRLQRMYEDFHLSLMDREKIDRYFNYVSSINDSNKMISYIKYQLPSSLCKQIIFEINHKMLLPVFKDFASDSFIEKLSHHITTSYYMPEDFIITKGDIGEEMFFIVEGRVAILASNKRTVIARLYKGDFFGEIALFLAQARVSYVAAETFCTVCVLTKNIVDKIAHNFPSVALTLKEIGLKRLADFHRKDTKGSEIDSNEIDALFSPQLQKKDDDFSPEKEEKKGPKEIQVIPKRGSTETVALPISCRRNHGSAFLRIDHQDTLNTQGIANFQRRISQINILKHFKRKLEEKKQMINIGYFQQQE